MNNTIFKFNKTKAIESMLYLAQRISNADVYGICKLLYLADKTCLEKYGRFMFGESYYALQEGATPSKAYDILKDASKKTVRGLKVRVNQIIPLRDANLDYLSEADIECLDLIINADGKVPNWERRRQARDEAWREAWSNRGSSNSVLMPVESMAKYLEDSEQLLDYLCNRDAE
jgi:uncharacterized phage-associated protein